MITCPRLQPAIRIAQQIGRKQIRPIWQRATGLMKLRTQLNAGFDRIAFRDPHDRIGIADTSDTEARWHSTGDHQVEDLRPLLLKAVQVGIKCTVQQHVARAHTESSAASTFLVGPGKHHCDIGAIVAMSWNAMVGAPVLPAISDVFKASH